MTIIQSVKQQSNFSHQHNQLEISYLYDKSKKNTSLFIKQSRLEIMPLPQRNTACNFPRNPRAQVLLPPLKGRDG